jgi:predicted MFS family arabinose efflux permease
MGSGQFHITRGRSRQGTGLPVPPAEQPFAMMSGILLSLLAVAAASAVAVALSADAALIRDSFGMSEFEVGAIASCIYIGAAASSLTGGRLTDRWGPGPVLVLVSVLLAAGEGLAAIAPSAWLFFAGVLVAGLGYGAVNPPTNVLANPRTARRRGLAISIKQSGVPLGGSLAALLVPAVAVTYGWRQSLLMPIALCLVLAVVFAWLRPAASTIERPEQTAGMAVHLKLPYAYAFGFLMGGVQVTIFTFLALYLVDEKSMSPEGAGSRLALLLFAGLIGRIAWGWMSDRQHHDRARVLQLISFLSAAALLLLTFVESWALPCVLLLIGLCSVGWNGVYIASITEATTPRLIGLVTGRSMGLVNLGAVLMPPAFGLLVRAPHGWVLAWTMCGAMTLLSLCVLQLSRAGPVIRPALGTGPG